MVIELKQGRPQLQKSMLKLLSVADVVSLTNAVLGFFSLIMVSLGEVRIAFSLILIAIVADGLDGIVARRVKHSGVGEYVDSIADIVSAGVAPSFFIYWMYQDFFVEKIYFHFVLVFVLMVFLLTCIIRLSSFHILKNKKYFVGLPVPASTIILVVLAYVKIDLVYMLFFIMVVSVLMVSNIRFLKPDIRIDIIAGFLIFLAVVFADSYSYFASFLLIGGMVLYILCSLVFLYVKEKDS